MRTVKTKLYYFDELSEDAQKVAVEDIQKNIDSWLIHDWYEFIVDDFKSEMLRVGIVVDDVMFSGFWSQGDGASFTASIDIEKYVDGLDNYKDLIAFDKEYGYRIEVIKKSHQYQHPMTMGISSDINERDAEEFKKGLFDKSLKLEEHVLAFCRDKASKLYDELKKEYVYITSYDYIAEELKAGEYEFLSSGKTARF